MTATQTQIRRDTDTNLMAATPALAELGYNQTTKRIHVGDGSTLGGTILPNASDTQLSSFSFGVAGGAANAITLTLNPSPVSYSQPLRIQFRATNTNTGGTTIDVNGIGTRNILKYSSGSLVALTAGDIVSGGIYEIVYDGTQFQLLNKNQAGITSVSQGDLNTLSGTVEVIAGSALLTLPGGQYGWYPIFSANAVGVNLQARFITDNVNGATLGSTPLARIWLKADGGDLGSGNLVATQRYVSSSPPYDLGDGEVSGFAFALVNSAGEIEATYLADTPPWAYNGRTDIRCTHICPVSKKKFRNVAKKRSFEQIMDGVRPSYKLEEITQDIKNADMPDIPHPFIGSDMTGKTVVLLDPMDRRIEKVLEYMNAGGDVSEIFKLIKPDNEKLKRCGPKGVMQCKFKMRGKNG